MGSVRQRNNNKTNRWNFSPSIYSLTEREELSTWELSELIETLLETEFSQSCPMSWRWKSSHRDRKCFSFLERLISLWLESWQFCNFWRKEARVIYWILCRRRHCRDFIISSRGKVCDSMITYICACFSTTVLGSWMLDYSITFPSYMQLKLYNALCTCCNFQYEFLLVGVRKVGLKMPH